MDKDEDFFKKNLLEVENELSTKCFDERRFSDPEEVQRNSSDKESDQRLLELDGRRSPVEGNRFVSRHRSFEFSSDDQNRRFARRFFLSGVKTTFPRRKFSSVRSNKFFSVRLVQATFLRDKMGRRNSRAHRFSRCQRWSFISNKLSSKFHHFSFSF